MVKKPWSRFEKRFLAGSLVLCAVPAAIAWLHGRQEPIPKVALVPRVIPLPNAETWLWSAWASYVRIGRYPKVEEETRYEWGHGQASIPPLFSPAYTHAYSLATKTPFLKANAKTLGFLQSGTHFPYAYSAHGLPVDNEYWIRCENLIDLLCIEAHAQAENGNWDGATNTLLEAYHWGCVLPRESIMDGVESGYVIRSNVRRDFWALSPYLSAQQLIKLAKRIEAIRAQVPSFAQSLEWNKRAWLEMLSQVIEQNDLRPLYVSPFGCAVLKSNPCGIPAAKMQRNIKTLSPLLQTRLAWFNKANYLREITRNLNWQIAEVKKPYPLRDKTWPFDPWKNGKDDILRYMAQLNYQGDSIIYARGEAQDALLSTSLALRAYCLQNGHYPRTLQQLVPNYLARVPLDPFSNGKILRYRDEPKRFLSRDAEEQFVPSPKGTPFPDVQPLTEKVPHFTRGFEVKVPPTYITIPFTLYSLGHNARDDGGSPYDADLKYIVNYKIPDSVKADIVAGINN